MITGKQIAEIIFPGDGGPVYESMQKAMDLRANRVNRMLSSGHKDYTIIMYGAMCNLTFEKAKETFSRLTLQSRREEYEQMGKRLERVVNSSQLIDANTVFSLFQRWVGERASDKEAYHYQLRLFSDGSGGVYQDWVEQIGWETIMDGAKFLEKEIYGDRSQEASNMQTGER